jgi:glycosyltransferase involved in cell wall biosynthesis
VVSAPESGREWLGGPRDVLDLAHKLDYVSPYGAMRLLLLTDRDWTHPEAGGTGTTLNALVSRWTARGHHVTLIAGAHPGASPVERPHPLLEIHRMGTRLTVFPRAAQAVQRGVGRDADVALEVVNGIAFCTPLWPSLCMPKVALVQHVHQYHYVIEAGWQGRIGALLLERLPLRYIYGRRTRIWTISQASRRDLIALGVPDKSIDVVYLGVDPPRASGADGNGHGVSPPLPRRKTTYPTLLYLGRLKRYKRVELLLDVLAAVPDAVLEVAGDGTHRAEFEAEVRRRGLSERVVMHGFVSEHDKAELYSRAWLNFTASSAEGWGHTVMEAATYATPSVALRVGGLAEAIVDGQTGALADNLSQLRAKVEEILASPVLRDRLGTAAEEWARNFSWDRAADEVLGLMAAAAKSTATEPDVSRPWRLVRRPSRSLVAPAVSVVPPAPQAELISDPVLISSSAVGLSAEP